MPQEKTKFETVEQYFASLPKESQKILSVVRKTIQSAAPGAEDVISYQIPAFKQDGHWVFYYSIYQHHFSLSCPPPFAPFVKFKKELAKYKMSKSAVQFPLDEPVPVELIKAMTKYQVEENKKREKKK
jgi:uncharacterized protein YdhG (YjbR/CyaY superfamily)